MPDNDPVAYYRLRESTERQLAASAPSSSIKKIHLELADAYARILAESLKAAL
jgi:hypothetical protein